MASSESTSTKKARDQRKHVGLQRIQNLLLIWLDSKAQDDTDDCRKTVAQLRRAVSDIHTYIDGELCLRFLETIQDNKICMIISDSLRQHVVPRVHGMSQVDAIFILCSNREHDEQWTKNWPKIKGIFTGITTICGALQQATQQCEHNATPMSFASPGGTGDRLDPSFMYTQILKEILLTIEFNEEHIQEYVDYCRDAFEDNPGDLAYITKLEHQYHEKTPIWWFTCESFLYRMFNKALRTMDGDIIVRMGFFINDLHRHIQREHQKQYAGSSASATFTVYRGQGLSTADFEQLAKIKGGLLSFNSFLSTNKRRTVSLEFAERVANNPDIVSVLFEMTIDSSQSTTPFVSIRDLSAIEGEDEVLFAMHSVFRVREIKVMDGNSRLYEVHLSLTSDNEPELRALTDRIREESFPEDEGWSRLALVLEKMGQLEKAEEIYETLLSRETRESDKAHLYHQLALIKQNRGEHAVAIEFYDRSIAGELTRTPRNHRNLANSYNNVGNVYYDMGEYSKAFASQEKALEIRQQSLPPTHPDLATSYNNIGYVYSRMGDHEKALAYHEKALDIQQQSLPTAHPDLAMSYNNIGNAYHSLGDYSKALESYKKTLEIRQQSLPPTHPSLAMSYNNIGSLYSRKGDYPKALAHFEKALAIRQQSLPPTHPNLAMSYNNFGNVYSGMGDYPKALAYFEKALAIRQQALPPTHPDLAATYDNLCLLYEKMGKHSKARSFSERAVKIAEQSLPPNHPDLHKWKTNLRRIKKKL